MQYKNGDQCLVQPKSSSNIHFLDYYSNPLFFRTIFEAENTIRGQHGITDTRNCGHGSGIENRIFH
jgi:hypothetical protein